MKSRIALLLVAVFAAVGLAVVHTAPASAAAPTYQIARQIVLPATGAGVAVDPARGLLYVAGRGSGAVWVYDEATLTLQHTIAVPNQPYNLAVGPTGLVYVSQYTGNNLAGTVSVIDPTTDAVVATLPTGNSPVGVAVSNDGSRLYVANLSSSFLSVFDLGTPAAPVALANLPLPGGSETVTESADGSTLFVPNDGGSVFVVATGTGTVTSTWTGFSSAHQVALSTDGTHAFVSQQLGGPMPVFSVASNTQAGTLPLTTTYYQATDAALGAGFVTQPFTNGGTLAVIDQSTGAVLQSVPGVTSAYYPAADPTTHSVFVTSITSSLLTQVVPAPPIVTTDPVSQTIPDGSTATFSAAASGASPITVQWQSSTNGGATWTDVAGATATSYTTPVALLADSGTRFRAVFTDAVGATATTVAATLTVVPAPVTVVTDPVSQTVGEGAAATFTAAASGTGPITVQWQSSIDGGTTWSDIAGATDTSYTTPDTASGDDGTQFRAVFTGPGTGNTATSEAATLTVTAVVPTPTPTPTSGPTSAPTTAPAPGTDLADTGSTSPLLPIVIAGLAAMAGAVVLVGSRRRLRR